MKSKCIVLVGMQGCGKSTFAKEYQKQHLDENFQIISQDELGKEEHKTQFQELIKQKKNIIIDRINHTYEQRKYYLELANKNNYQTQIINLNLPLKECVKRLLERKNHPTFNPKTYYEATKVLYLYLKEYQKPQEYEADSIENPTQFDPYCLDLRNKYSKFIIIGDIHGCYDEMIEFLEQEEVKNFKDNNTAIVFIGDLIDKGPKIKEVLDFYFSSPNCYCIRGNHEYKLQRYLRGNNITISHGLQDTLDQCNLDKNSEKFNEKYAQFLLKEFDSLPFMIQIGNNDFIVHAGIHPKRKLFMQPKEYFIFARTYNPITHSFNTENDLNWFDYYNENSANIYFGHNYHKEIILRKNVFSLDGYCVYGDELRGCLVEIDSSSKEVISQDFLILQAHKEYYEKTTIHFNSLLSQIEYLVDKGYIKKSQDNKQNLVLYNYTQKTVYEKNWDSYTMQCRGLIFDSTTQKIVARPFGKFFNINENEFTQLHELPNEEFEVFEKKDGMLGIVFFHNNSWRLSTRGDLNSEHAKIGQELLDSLHTNNLDSNYTYLFEIIHPKCRVVIEAKEKELVLIGAIHTQYGSELNYEKLKKISTQLNTPIISKIEKYSSLHQILEDKKSWKYDFEGVVIRFKSGLRVKIKGDEYLQFLKIKESVDLNSLINLLNKNGDISFSAFYEFDEEIQKEVEEKIIQIEEKYIFIKKKAFEEFAKIYQKNISRKEFAKKVDRTDILYSKLLFNILDKNEENIHKNIIDILKRLNFEK